MESESKDPIQRLFGGLVVCGALVAIALSLSSSWGHFAAWVMRADFGTVLQAVLSGVGVIGAAIGIWWQVRQQRRQLVAGRLLADLDALRSHHKLLLFAEALVDRMATASTDEQTYHTYLTTQHLLDRPALVLSILQAVEPREIPDPGMKLAHAVAREEFRKAEGQAAEALVAMRSGAYFNPTLMAYNRKVFVHALEGIAARTREFDTTIKRLESEARAV